MHEELSVSWDEDGKRGSWLSPGGLLFQTATNFLSKLSRNVGGSLDPSRLSKTARAQMENGADKSCHKYKLRFAGKQMQAD